MRLKAAVLATFLAATSLAAARAARADDDAQAASDARALVLFNEGRGAMEAGRYAEAAAKFADSEALDPGAGTMLNLAFCYEKTGKLAAAWREYRAAAANAHEHGKTEWEDAARTRAARLAPAVGWVAVHVARSSDAKALEVQIDGAPMALAMLEQPVPVDPGTHEVRVSAPGKKEWSARFEADGEHAPVIEVPDLEPEAVVAPTLAAPPPEPPRRASADRGGGQRAVAIALGALGVGAIAAGSVLGLVAKSTFDGAECSGNLCTAAGHDAQSRAYVQADVATASFIVAGAALGGAAFFWFSAPPRDPPPSTLRLRPVVGGAWGLSMEGIW